MNTIDVVEGRGVEPLTTDDGPTIEQTLSRSMLKGLAVCIPAGVVILVGLVALAISGGNPDWLAWLGMAASVGVLAGTFFGMMAGFLKCAPMFED